MTMNRRTLFQGALAGAAVPALARVAVTGGPAQAAAPTEAPQWGVGADGQRKADLGNGFYRNPIVSGDHPDPTILKDGDVYYMTFSSFDSYPALVIWRSTDLVNWAPVGPALHRNLGTIWAVDLVKHDGRYFIYIPADPKGEGWSIFVIWADDIAGPWSEPVDLKISGCIDPGHVVGEDGKRYLFTNGIRMIPLTDDGLATAGPLVKAYDPGAIPMTGWSRISPRRPQAAAAGRVVLSGHGHRRHRRAGDGAYGDRGALEIDPRPLGALPAQSAGAHGQHRRTLVVARACHAGRGPAGDWWMVYHGYENGMRTLGRQTLLEPIEWTADGWFRAKGGDLSQPLRKPQGGKPSASAPGLSDDFTKDRMGVQWSFHAPKRDEGQRASYGAGGLTIAASGRSPADSSPLTCLVGDRGYEAEVSIDLTGKVEAGLLLFYNYKAFVGVGFTPEKLKIYEYSEELPWAAVPHQARSLRLRVTNDENVVTWHYSHDEGRTWQRHGTRMEVSGIHHNVFGGFLSLRLGLYVAGDGEAKLRDFRYRAIGKGQ
jgi:xylan 1,4-beta-xylosidase